MSSIKDFKCTYDNGVLEHSKIVEELGFTFPDVYLHADKMAALSKRQKEKQGNLICVLPFCHTVEGEAMGGIITLGNEVAGPRAKEYLYTDYKELGEINEIDFTKGRIQEVLQACHILHEQGEHVMLEVSGPITILNVLIDIKQIFKGMRKDFEFMKSVFHKVGTQILSYIKEAKKYGVDFISYADSAGGVNILGPKMAEQMVEGFTYDFLKEAQEYSDEHTLLMLCPKTTFALLGTEKAELADIDIPAGSTYGEGCIEVLGKAKMVGIQCAKNMGFLLKSGIMKEVVLK